MKTLYVMYALCLCALGFSQSQGNQYVLDWGTYIGPRLEVGHISTHGNTLRVRTYGLDALGQAPENYDYFNGYSTDNNTVINPNSPNNFFLTHLSATGQVLGAKYEHYHEVLYSKAKNSYRLTTTPNAQRLPYSTWLPDAPSVPSHGRENVILSKYTSTGELAWQTYLPFDGNYERLYSPLLGSNLVGIPIYEDEEGNIYISEKIWVEGLGTAGAWLPNFDNKFYYFIAKLNAEGKLQWCTYSPFPARGIHAYGGKVGVMGYVWHERYPIATPMSFQEDPSFTAIVLLDGNTGQRIWGTYYGIVDLHGIILSDNALLLFGNDYHSVGSSYCATSGAIKPFSTSIGDAFISSFELATGQRKWSTYLGGNGTERRTYPRRNTSSVGFIGYGGGEIFEGKKMCYKNGKILYAGVTDGSTNNISTNNAYQTEPANYYFTLLNDDGELLTTSYYGTPNNNTSDSNIILGGYCAFSEVDDGFYLSGGSSGQSGFIPAGATYSNTHHIPNGWAYGQHVNMEQLAGFILKFKNIAPLSTEENKEKDNGFLLYNNPNGGKFSIVFHSKKVKFPLQVSVHDVSGKQVYQQIFEKALPTSFDLETILTDGIYYLSVKDSQQNMYTKTMKVVK